MKKIISIAMIFSLLVSSLTALYVKADETNEQVNPFIIPIYRAFYSSIVSMDDVSHPDYNDKSKMIVVDHSIYYLENNEYTCIEFFNTEDFALNATEITVKDYINGIPVTRVNGSIINYKNKYKNSFSKLTKVNIPNTVKTIGVNAFCNLKKITELTLPNSITNIEESAFANTNITKINIPSNLKNSCRSFSRMNKLRSIIIPKGLDLDTNTELFWGNDKLSKIIFENNDFSTIGAGMFNFCPSIKKIKLPNGLKEIKRQAFNEVGFNGTITIPKNCNKIWDESFSFCNNLKKVDFKGKNISVLDDAFSGCDELKKIIGTENIVEISFFAFANCRSLRTFTISKKLKKIEDYAFCFCKSMKKIKILTTNTKAVHGKKVFKGLPKKCKIYVKTYRMKKAVKNSGFKGTVIVKKNLK